MKTPNYLNYQQYYNPTALWEKIKKYGKSLGKEAVYHVLVLYYIMADPKTPLKYKAIIAGALGYLIFPLDLIPDAIPVIGFSDDIAAITAAYKACADCISPEIQAKARAKVSAWFD